MRRPCCPCWMDPYDSHAVERAISQEEQSILSAPSNTAIEIVQGTDWELRIARVALPGISAS